MDSPLRVLILEDNPNDAELALLELRRAGYTVDWRRVDNENDFLAALATPIDIILADYQLPQFDGMRALRLLRDRGLDAPFILLSGTVGEDIAVEAVKLSADDYLLKDRLARLGPAVTNALQAKAMRDEQRRMQQILQRRLSFEQLAVAISTRLLSAGAGQVDAAVQATLQNIGEFSDAAYCFLHLFGADGITVERGYEWHIDGAQPLTEKLLGNSLLQLRRRFRNIRSHAAANVYRLANSPLRTDGMFDPLQFQNARYLLWVPLVLREAMLGYFGLAASHEFSSWDDEDMALLRILGESYANVITRAQAEERLAGERNLFRTVIDNLPDAIYAKDRAGRFILVNPGVSHLLGTAPEDILGKTDLQFFSTEEALQYMADDQSVMTAGGTIREQAEVVRDHAGRPFWYASTKVPLRDGQDNIIGMVGIGRDITERKRAEEELRKREQQLSSIYDTVADVIFHLAVEKDGRYRFISVNQAFLSTAGLDYDQVVGKQVNEVIPEPSLTMVLGKYAEAIREKRIVRWEETSEYPTGRLTGEVSVAPVFDDAGNCIHLVGAVHDITERKRAEEALRHSRDLLDLTGQMAKVGGWELDLKTQTLSWTEEVYRIHEVDPATRLDVAEAINFYAPEARPVIAAAVQAGIDSATPWDLELPLITAQERRVWVRAQGAAERKDGRTVRLYGAFQDITERKRAEDAVRESERKYRRLVDLLQEGIWSIDAENRTTFVNPHMATMLGYTPEEMQGRVIFDFLDERASQNARQDLDRFRRGMSAQAETEFICKDGGRIYAALEVTPLIDEQGDYIGALAGVMDMTERRRAEEQISRQLTTLSTLYDGARRMAETLDARKLAAGAVASCVKNFDAYHAWIGVNEPDGSVRMLAHFPPDVYYLSKMSVRWDDDTQGSGVVMQAIRSGATAIKSDLQNSSSDDPWHAIDVQYGLDSVAGFPLISRQHVIGVLSIASQTPNYFTPERVAFFEGYALQAASSLENARLFGQTERRLQQVQALHKIDLAIVSGADLHMTLGLILDHVMIQLGVDGVAVQLMNQHSHALTCAAALGFRTHNVQKTRLQLGRGAAGLAALERQIVACGEVHGAPGLFRALEDEHCRSLNGAEGFVAQVAIPLLAKGQAQGALEIYNRSALTIDSDWVEFLETLAGQIAIAIDNASLYDNLQRAINELAQAYEATIEGWSRALDLRDRETEGHTQRVTAITVDLARALGLDESEIVHIRRGALLHDIGKMGVPDGILLKPGPLNEEEWRLMRLHPTYAYNLLWPISFLRPALDIPYCHHEKWDGSGYPRGLKGEDIPLAARIFAVADVWDALRSDRPYRKAWSDERAREYLREQSGSHFDPQLVDAFLRINGFI